MFYFTFICLIFALNLYLIKSDIIPFGVDCDTKCPVNVTIYGNGAYEIAYAYRYGICECPAGWTPGPENECLYYLGPTSLSYTEAVQQCANRYNARLLTIKNEVKQKFVTNFINGHNIDSSFWLDAVRISKANADSSFIWSDGTGMTYSNWVPTEPNNHAGDQSCVQLIDRRETAIPFKWDDISCSAHISWGNHPVNVICERPICA